MNQTSDRRFARSESDLLGRTVRTIENYADGTAAAGDTDQDRVTQFIYDDKGRLSIRRYVNANATSVTNQDTVYQYHSALHPGLVTNTLYPDSADTLGTAQTLASLTRYGSTVTAAKSSHGYAVGDAIIIQNAAEDEFNGWYVITSVTTDAFTFTGEFSSGTPTTATALAGGITVAKSGVDQVVTSYDSLGRVKTTRDQRGVIHKFNYDSVGRLQSDVVANLGEASQNVDGTVRRLERTYDDLGRVLTHSSYDAASGGNVLNQVKYTYDGWGNVVREDHAHTGAVDENTLAIEYAYTTGASSGEAKYVRLSTMTYPNGREVDFGYGSTGSISDRLSRVDTIGGTGGDMVNYTYLGSGMIIGVIYPQVTDQPGLSYGSAANDYVGFDRFGRIVQQNWIAGATDLVNIEHGYDAASNRLYANNTVNPQASQAYLYDGLDRLVDFKAGLLSGDEVSDAFISQAVDYQLDAQGNWTSADGGWYEYTANAANEYTSRTVDGGQNVPTIHDFFDDSGTESHWVKPGSGDSFNIDTSHDSYLTFTALTADNFGGYTESEARAMVILPVNVAQPSINTTVIFPTGTTSGQAGIVYGYKSANNYKMLVLDIGAQKQRFYAVTNGAKTLTSESGKTINANTAYLVNLDEKLYDYTSGSVGLITTSPLQGGQSARFANIKVKNDGAANDMLGRWLNHSCDQQYSSSIDPTTDTMLMYYDGDRPNSRMLQGLRLDQYQFVFSMQRQVASGVEVRALVHGEDDRNHLSFWIRHQDTKNLPYANEYRGNNFNAITPDTTSTAAIPTLTQNDTLWVNITNDGTTLSVKMLKGSSAPSQQDWDNATACWTKAVSGLKQTSGLFGFADPSAVKIDNVTVSSWGGSDWVTEHKETFTVDSSNERTESILYDAAGNLTFDGVYFYGYDAWNRLSAVQKAYADDAGDMQTPGQVWWTAAYDATGRRIMKQLAGTGSWDETYHFYYNGQSMIETRDAELRTIKQHVWGVRYVDDLVQIANNRDYAADHDCLESTDEVYYALQDANWNVVAIVRGNGSLNGDLAERYEYDPYGGRQAFTKGSADDQWLLAPLYNSRRVGENYLSGTGNWTSTPEAWGRNEFGHQGLMHDEELGSINNRGRQTHTVMGRFFQRDPNPAGIYNDGGSLYQYVGGNAVNGVDAWGLQAIMRDAGEGGAAGAEVWTFSGINNWGLPKKASPGTPKQFNDYVAADLGLSPDRSFVSRAGTTHEYNQFVTEWRPHWAGGHAWEDVPNPQWNGGFHVKSLRSETLLNNEAVAISDKEPQGSFSQEWCVPRIRVIMVAPKTHTRPVSLLGGGGCALTVDIYFDPQDPVPNQGLFGADETDRFWSEFGRSWPVNTGPVASQWERHHFGSFLDKRLPISSYGPVNHPRQSVLQDVPPVRDAVARAVGEGDFDYVFVCHSQGCNIAMHVLNRVCKRW